MDWLFSSSHRPERRAQDSRQLKDFADFALEDAWAAGALILKLKAERLSDSAQAMAALAAHWKDPAFVLRQARNGRALIARGREKEVEWCARESELNIVGEMKSAEIRSLQP